MRMIYMPTGMLSAAVTLSGWHNFFEARGPAGYSEPNSWDPEDEDEMDEILYHRGFHPFHPRLLDYGYGFSYVHLRVMALFFPYPNLAFAEDPPFHAETPVRRWERIGSDSWKMWRAFASSRLLCRDEILYGYGFSYVHLPCDGTFYSYPNLAFAKARLGYG